MSLYPPPLHSLPRLMRLTVQNPHPIHQLVLSAPVIDQPNRWSSGSLREVSRLCHRSTISSPDIDWSGKRVRWAVIVKNWSKSSTPLTCLLRCISPCLSSTGIYTAWLMMPTGPLTPSSLTIGGKLSKMDNSFVSHR